MLLTLATLAAFVPQGPGSSVSPVCINEFSYDDDGGDDLEFVELYNRAGTPVDISGWSLEGIDGTNATTPSNGSYVFPGAPGSMTTVIVPGQYLMIAQSLVPNYDPTHPLPGGIMENGAEGLVLQDDQGNVIDSVTWEFQLWSNPIPPWLEGDGIQGAIRNNQGFGFNGGTAQRWFDGYDDDNNGLDFANMVWTPGSPNGLGNLLPLPIVENCDGGVGTFLDTIFSSSWARAAIQDPAVISVFTGNTISVPPSPQGGNVCTMNDTTGGGNSHTTMTFPTAEYLVECWVYIQPNPLLLGNEGEAWSIGVGSVDGYGHPVDVSGNYLNTIQCSPGNGAGNTGLAWTALSTMAQTELYLVDYGDGGPGFTVLGGPIIATTGVNDGWQRIRLRVSGNDVVGNFGGTFGVDDGQRFTGTTTQLKFGQAYFEYRECIVNNSNIRPLIIDRLEIYSAAACSVAISGTGSPTTVGQPAIGSAGGPPCVGNSTFEFTASGMIPNGIGLIAIDVGAPGPGLPVPGGPATLVSYVNPTFLGTVFNTAGGSAAFNLPIPGVNGLSGASISAQFFDLDIGLGTAIPLGSSEAAEAQLGNG